MATADAHQLVPGGVELDLVEAVAVAVVGAQLRPVLVGVAPRAIVCRRAGMAPSAREPLLAQSPPSRRSASTQRTVGIEEVVVARAAVAG